MPAMRTLAAPRIGLAAALMAALAVHAQEDPLAAAQKLMAAGQAAQAFQILDAAEVTRAGEVDFDLALAIAANEIGDFPRAIMALERVLAVQPDNERARAEMGRALLGVGDNKAARALLSESKDKGFVAVAGETIDQLLHAIDRVEAEGRSSAKGFVEGSVGYDSNINSAPGASSVAVPAYGGAVLPIDPAGLRSRGSFLGYAGGASGRWVIDTRWSLIGTANVRGQLFGNSNNHLDNNQVDANVGASYRLERHEFSLATQFSQYSIDHDRVRDQWGLVGEWTYRLDGFRQFNAYFQTGRLTYPQQRLADVNRNVVGATYAHLTRGGVWSYGGIYYGRESTRDASVPYLGHKEQGIRGGMQIPLSGPLGVFFSAGWEQRRYGGLDPLFLVARRDEQFNASVGLSWIPAPLWRVTPQVLYVHTSSNVALARFDKTVLSVALKREF